MLYRVNTKTHFHGYKEAETPQQAAQMCSDKKLKLQPSETHWTKEAALAAQTSDSFLVANMDDKHTEWYLFYPEQRKAKITLSDGNHFITSMNHELTDEQILDYYKVGQKINMGKGENDYYTTIQTVTILQ